MSSIANEQGPITDHDLLQMSSQTVNKYELRPAVRQLDHTPRADALSRPANKRRRSFTSYSLLFRWTAVSYSFLNSASYFAVVTGSQTCVLAR